MFLLRYKLTETGAYQAPYVLSPGPTAVDYPPRRLFVEKEVQDGGSILQRPIWDSRPRRWIWKGYHPRIPVYERQWAELERHDTLSRLRRGEPATVQIWEDESTVGGFGKTTDGLAPNMVSHTNLQWTTVRFVQVSRDPRDNGGLVVYEESVVEFRIAGDYTDF